MDEEKIEMNPDEEEKKIKLDKKSGLMYGIIFIILIVAAMVGGGAIALNKQPQTTTPFEYSAQNTTAEPTASAPTQAISAVPATVEPTTAALVATLPQPAPTTAPKPQTTAATTAPFNTDAAITQFEISTDNLSDLGKALYKLGFVYNAQENMFFTPNDPWQRNMGYTTIYDDFSVVANMYYDTVRFHFKYGDKKWMYQIWKGRYGATSGCEMGVYYQDRRTNNKQFFDVPTDEDPLPGMYFELYRYEDYLFKNGPARHWWLTGFRLLDSSGSDALRMKLKYYMPNKEICDAFEASVKEQCAALQNLSYTREENVISLDWAY